MTTARSVIAASTRAPALMSVMTAARISAQPVEQTECKRQKSAGHPALFFRSESLNERIGSALVADPTAGSMAADETDVVPEG